MPELDFALLCDYVRVEGGLAHIVSAGIDTIRAPQVPAGQNVGIVARIGFTRQECTRPHRLEVIFQDADGLRLAEVSGVSTPVWTKGLPPGWRQTVILGLNIGVPLPSFGLSSFEILLNDSQVKTIPLRVVEAAEAAAPEG